MRVCLSPTLDRTVVLNFMFNVYSSISVEPESEMQDAKPVNDFLHLSFIVVQWYIISGIV